MKKYINYFIIQCKSAWRIVPNMFAKTVLFAFLAVIIAYAGARSLYGSDHLFYFKIAAVLPENDSMVTLGYNMLMEMGGIEEYCEIIDADEETAIKLLKQGDVYCVIYIPEGFVEDVLNGTNTPAKLILPDNLGLETVIFKSVLNAGASSLAYAQAGVYAVSDVYYMYDLRAEADDAIDRVNQDYFRFVFNRNTFNKITTLESTDVLSLSQFYLCCGLTLFILFLGLILGDFIKLESRTTTLMLSRAGIPVIFTTICKTLILAFMQSLMIIVILLIGKFTISSFASGKTIRLINSFVFSVNLTNILKIFVCELVATSFIITVFEAAGTGLYGILALFIINCAMMFASGLIIPSAYLPEFITKAAYILPTTRIKEILSSMYTGDLSIGSVAAIVISLIVMTLLSSAINKLYQKIQ